MEFITYKIGDVAKITAGGDAPKNVSDVPTETCNVPIYSNGIDNEGLYGYTDKAKIEGDSVTVTARGVNIGTAFYRKEPFLPIVRLLSIVPNRTLIYPKYLYYYLKGIEIIGTGSAQPQIPVPFFSRKKIKICKDICVQQKIAESISMYDELIENNNKRINLLEQMAENLYKEWFVRFRFPGHENVEFENGLPKGWEVKRLKDYGVVETGKTPSTEVEDNYGEDYLFIKTPDMHGNIWVIDTTEKLSEKGHGTQRKKKLPKGSIMVSCIGTGGVVAINSKEGHTNQQINSIILEDECNREWLYMVCVGLKSTIEMFGATGSTMTNLSKGKFENLKIIEPPYQLRMNYHRLAKEIFAEVEKLMYANDNLIKQRDLLLPRLMSGKLEVK